MSCTVVTALLSTITTQGICPQVGTVKGAGHHQRGARQMVLTTDKWLWSAEQTTLFIGSFQNPCGILEFTGHHQKGAAE